MESYIGAAGAKSEARQFFQIEGPGEEPRCVVSTCGQSEDVLMTLDAMGTKPFSPNGVSLIFVLTSRSLHWPWRNLVTVELTSFGVSFGLNYDPLVLTPNGF